MNRFGPSILIEAGDKKFLFDVGRGAMQHLAQIKTKWQDIDGVFFTHLHSDHERYCCSAAILPQAAKQLVSSGAGQSKHLNCG